MGNEISFDVEDMNGYYDVDSEIVQNEIRHVISSMMIVGPHSSRPTNQMPVIRKKPDLRQFRLSQMYREVKYKCGMSANSRRPNDNFSLQKGLLKREQGLARHHAGSFTQNQMRRIANLYVPNKKDVRLMSLESKVFVSKFNSDGSKLITACQDSVIRIYDSSKGTYHRINKINAKDVHWSILDIDFSPCGKYFCYSTWADYFFVVPVNGTAHELQMLDLNTYQNRMGVFSIRFSPCGRSIIGGCTNSVVYHCDRETRTAKSLNTQRNFQTDINAVTYITNQDSNIFLSGCNSGVLKLWDLRCIGEARPQSVGVFMGHFDGITYMDSRNDGNYVLSNSKDQSIKIWDLRKTTQTNMLNKYTNLPLIDWDYRWDTVPREYYNPAALLEGDVSIMTYRGHRVTKSLLRAKFSPLHQTGQRYIYTGCGTGRIIIYDVLTGLIKEAIEGHKDIVRDLDWHPIRSEIVSSSWDSHVNLNTFKRNLQLKRDGSSSSSQYYHPLRRSRRIAHQNGELDDEEMEGYNHDNQL